MPHTNKSIRLSAKLILLSFGLTLAACGGGGSGSDDSAVSYSGNTSQANIDETQAEEIAKAFVNTNQTNEDVGGIVDGVNITSNQTLDDTSKIFIIEKIKDFALASKNQNTNLPSGVTGSMVLIGDCSAYGVTSVSDGTATGTIINQSNTYVKTQVTFSNLCIYEVTTNSYAILNGVVNSSIEGSNLLDTNNPSTAVIDRITLSVPNLSVRYTDSSENSLTITISESYDFRFTYDASNNLTQTTFLMYTDFKSYGLVYRYAIEIVDTTGGSTTTLRFYHPSHGYIEYISTLTFACSNGSADGGTLIIAGTNATYTITPSGACDNSFTVTDSTPTATTPVVM